VREALAAMLVRVDLDEPLFTADDAARLPVGAWDDLLAAGLVRPAAIAVSVPCGSCADAHEEAVRWTRAPRGRPSRPYIPCPEVGSDWVEPERLARWAVDLDGLARAAADAIGAAGGVEDLLTGELWLLGHVRVGGDLREVFLGRRLARVAVAARVAACERLRRAVAPVLLAAGNLPPSATWSADAPVVLTLASVVDLVHGRLAAVPGYLAAAVGRPQADPGAGQVSEPAGPVFPTPRGATWSDVEIRFRDGHTISIRVLGARGIYTYAQLGLTNRTNGAPDKQWLLLEAMSREHGALTWNNAFRDHRNKKRRARLSERLVAFFGIDDGDPITYDKVVGGWRTRFKLQPEGEVGAA
jgi:hypothetical protein